MGTEIYSAYLCIVIPLFFVCFLIEKKARNIIIFYIIGTFQYLVINELGKWLYENVFFEKISVEHFYIYVEPTLFIAALIIPFALYIISTSDNSELRQNVSIAFATGFATIQALNFSQYDEMNYLYIISDVVMLSLWNILCMVFINKGIGYVIGEEKNIIKGIALFILVLIFETVCIAMMAYSQHLILCIILFIVYIPIILRYYMNLKKERIAKRHR